MILIGNIFTFLASTCSIIATRSKTYNKTLLIQSIDALLFAAGSFFLGGSSGVVINLISIVRNLICIFFDLTKPIKILLVAVTVIPGIIFMDREIYGILPIIASTFYLIVVLNTKDVTKLKIGLLVNNILWLIYGLILLDISGTCFNIFSTVSIIQILVKNRKKGGEDNGKCNNTENATECS